MSIATIAFRQKLSAWPQSSDQLYSFASAEGLDLKRTDFQSIAFSSSNDFCTVEYIVSGGKTRGTQRMSMSGENVTPVEMK